MPATEVEMDSLRLINSVVVVKAKILCYVKIRIFFITFFVS